MGDIVYEAEVPAVSTEEVIASVAPTKWDLTPKKNSKKTNRSKPKSPTKEIRYDKYLNNNCHWFNMDIFKILSLGG